MNYRFLDFLFSWIFPTKRDRRKFRRLCRTIDNRKTTKQVQLRYKHILNNRPPKDKYNVVFLVNEISKWKYQSLYDAMKNSKKYYPIIVLTIADIQNKLAIEDKKKIIEKSIKFFKMKNMDVRVKYDLTSNKALPLKDLNPDIVFYQQPYDLSKNQAPLEISKYAITAYVPYYLPDFRNLELDCETDFHHKLYRYYVLNEELKQEYEEHLQEINEYSGNLKAVGHTMLDLFKENQEFDDNGYVIYAPHWSIPLATNKNTINISTFDKNGMFILNYAKMHPEINWVFKPHPTLKTALKRIGWTTESIENYYNEWNKIALVSYDSNYVDLFMKSKAMITDSGSFLLEYFVTGKPLLHLISDAAINMPYAQLKKYFDTFYEIRNNEELVKSIENIILNKQDYKANKRKILLENSAFIKENAAQNILKDLDNIFEEAKE